MRIGICGCGWLGLPLAKKLMSQGHNIVASKRSEQRAAELNEQGIKGLAFNLGEDLFQARLHDILDNDVLVLNVPPGRNSFVQETFLENMKALIKRTKDVGTKRIIFISTSAVYGESTRNVYEYSNLDPATESAKAHVKIEQCAQQTFGNDACILRLSGLVGPERHPAKFLAGKRELGNGQKVVNLIHLDDVMEAVARIIEDSHFGQVFHLCSTEHPTRQKYYQWAATKLALPAPEFALMQDVLDTGKTINAEFSLEKLGLTLAYPSPFDMLNEPTFQ